MYFSLQQQLLATVQALGLGVVVGIAFELVRVWRRLCPSAVAEFVRDFLFVTGAVLLSSWFYIRFAQGQLRWFYLLAELAGAVLFHKLIGRFCYEPLGKLMQYLSGLLRQLFFYLVAPIVFLFKFSCGIIYNIFKKLFIFIKKYIIIFTSSLFQRKKNSKERKKSHGKDDFSQKEGYSQFYH